MSRRGSVALLYILMKSSEMVDTSEGRRGNAGADERRYFGAGKVSRRYIVFTKQGRAIVNKDGPERRFPDVFWGYFAR